MDIPHLLFYFIFLGQILLLSYILPRKLSDRIQFILDQYPPETYPKLYPKSIEYYKIGLGAFRIANRGFLLLGVVLLFVIGNLDPMDDGSISEAWPAIYAMLQYMPTLALELLGFSQLKKMRESRYAAKRTVELRRRRVFDHLSPALLAAAVLLYFATILFDLYAHDFVFHWDHDTFQRTLIMTLGNLFFIAMGSWHLYGRKQDPHQADEDRDRQISTQLNALALTSIAVSLFLMFSAAGDLWALEHLEAPVLSLYFQALGLVSVGYTLRQLKLEDINFDVYKNGQMTT